MGAEAKPASLKFLIAGTSWKTVAKTRCVQTPGCWAQARDAGRRNSAKLPKDAASDAPTQRSNTTLLSRRFSWSRDHALAVFGIHSLAVASVARRLSTQ